MVKVNYVRGGEAILKLADIVDRITINPRKLTHYALDPDSPYGRHKAILFESTLGFTTANYVDLLKQLETKALDAEATFHSEDEFGKRYRVDIEVEGVEGQQATVRTGWFIPPGSYQAHLATLYIKKDKR